MARPGPRLARIGPPLPAARGREYLVAWIPSSGAVVERRFDTFADALVFFRDSRTTRRAPGVLELHEGLKGRPSTWKRRTVSRVASGSTTAASGRPLSTAAARAELAAVKASSGTRVAT